VFTKLYNKNFFPNITCGNLIAYDKSFNLNINPHKLHDKTEFQKLNMDNQTMNDFVRIKETQTTKQSKQIQFNNNSFIIVFLIFESLSKIF